MRIHKTMNGRRKKHLPSRTKPTSGCACVDLVYEGFVENEEMFARIIVRVYTGRTGDFDSLNFDLSSYSQQEIDEYDKQLRESTESQLSSMGATLLSWRHVTLERVNGMSCWHVRYIRQLLQNPPVMENLYIFDNDDREYAVLLIYRIEDEDIWKDDMEHALSTFRIGW